MTGPRQVLRRASEADGMLPVIILLGRLVLRRTGSPKAFEVLKKVGLSRTRAWQIVEQWEATAARTMETGWTPEAVAVSFIMEDVPGWAKLPWKDLLGDLQVPAG